MDINSSIEETGVEIAQSSHAFMCNKKEEINLQLKRNHLKAHN